MVVSYSQRGGAKAFFYTFSFFRRSAIGDSTINLSKISVINEKINSNMHLSELLTVILEIAKDLIGSEGASMLLAEPRTGDLTFSIVHGSKKETIKGFTVPKGKGIAGIVAETGKPLLVNNVQDDPRFFKDVDSKSNFLTRNIICAPMMVMGKFVGVLEAVNTHGRDDFEQSDLDLLCYIADQAAIAITNRKLFDELTSRIEELTALFEVSQALTLANVDGDIFTATINSIAHSLSVNRVSLILHDPEKGRLTLKAGLGLPEGIRPGVEIEPESSVAGYVFRTGDPLIVSDRLKDLPVIPPREYSTYSSSSFIAVPLRSKNTTIGVLSITDKKNNALFDAFDLRVVSTIANYFAESYQNVQFRSYMEAQKRLAREIDIAADIQRKILPAIPPFFQTHRLSAFNKPAKEVGGDLYDYFPVDDQKYAVLVGDVSGKGIPSALFMGSARNIIRAEMRMNSQPGALLTHSNKYVYEESESGMFVTLFYVLVDAHNSIFTYASAGHNDQLLMKGGKKEVKKLNAKGKPLGLLEDALFEERVAMYEPGDTLILFTDGVLDYFGNGDIDRGEAALIDIAHKSLGISPTYLIDYLKDQIGNNTLDSSFIDDFTILTIKF
jgi:phosphoserine phosphatase RsbU/P